MNSTAWQKRFRRLATVVGTVSSLYLLVSYTLDRLREARVTALKDRQIKDRLRSHFTTLLSTISFTLYALLPTLGSQLADRYPIEQTSQALQGMSMTSSAASIEPEHRQAEETDNSLHLNRGESDAGTSVSGNESMEGTGVGESWASEFQRRDGDGQAGERDELSSATSQSISLPTDISSDSNSPPSNISSSIMLSPSPPRRSPPTPPKSKKELWKDLKVQSIAKSLTTAYLVPLLLILTSSQLSTLARVKYLNDIKTTLPRAQVPFTQEDVEEEETPVLPVQHKSGWFNYFSLESMGLAEYADNTSPSPLQYVTRFLPGLKSSPGPVEGEIFDQDEEEDKAEAERLFLNYSWWLLNEGWQEVADRVDDAVERVFANMPLKREFGVEDWYTIIKEVRAIVETDNGEKLHDFTSHILPPAPLTTSSPNCPLPTHPEASPYLMQLLGQTRQQLQSADGRHLLERGVSAMVKSLCESMRTELYTSGDLASPLTRRLVDCLPEMATWSKGIWNGIPDSGVEGLVSLPEYESFAALVFGDWA